VSALSFHDETEFFDALVDSASLARLFVTHLQSRMRHWTTELLNAKTWEDTLELRARIKSYQDLILRAETARQRASKENP